MVNKLCFGEYSFPGNCQADEIVAILWKPELWEIHKAVLSPPVASTLMNLMTAVIAKLLVFNTAAELGEGDGEMTSQKDTQIIDLTNIQSFFFFFFK